MKNVRFVHSIAFVLQYKSNQVEWGASLGVGFDLWSMTRPSGSSYFVNLNLLLVEFPTLPGYFILKAHAQSKLNKTRQNIQFSNSQQKLAETCNNISYQKFLVNLLEFKNHPPPGILLKNGYSRGALAYRLEEACVHDPSTPIKICPSTYPLRFKNLPYILKRKRGCKIFTRSLH